MKKICIIIAATTTIFNVYCQGYESSQKTPEQKIPLTPAEIILQWGKPESKQKKIFTCTLAWMSGEQPKETCQIRDFLKMSTPYAQNIRPEPVRNVFLFYGKPGTGKTTGAELVAQEAGVNFAPHQMNDLVSKHKNDLGNTIKKIYDDAQETVKKTDRPVIILFDDLSEESEQRDALGILKTYLQKYSGNPYIITILTTNRDLLVFDESFRGRCAPVHWPMPDEVNRFAIIFDAIRKEHHQTNAKFLKGLAKKTGDFTPRNLVNAAQNSRMITEADKCIPDEKIRESFAKEQLRMDEGKSSMQKHWDFWKWMFGYRL